MNENLKDLKQKDIRLSENNICDELIAVCTEIIELEQEPYLKAATYLRGLAYLSKYDPDQAIADFNTILEQDPANTWVHFYRDLAYGLKSDDDKAIADYTKGLKFKFNLVNAYDVVSAYHLRGFAYIRNGNFLKGFKDFVKTNECDPVLKTESPEIYVAGQIADIYKDPAEEEGDKAFKLYFRLQEAISTIQKKQFYCPEKSKEVAHYTSLHTLKNLANKGLFRLYNAAYMNDPEEGRIFFDIMKKYEIDVQQVFYGDDDPSYPSPAYIGSFVKIDKNEPEQKDELFLWRTYGKHDEQEAAGACLIFKHEGTVFAENCGAQVGAMQQLQSELPMSEGDRQIPRERQPQKPELYEIVYSDEGNNQELSEELEKLAESLKRIKEHIEEEKDNASKKKLKKFARNLLDTIRFLFKARHYREEKEVRVVQVRYYDEKNTTKEEDGIRVDTEQIPPRFYLETHENFRFNEIILGPQTRGVHEWNRWLKEQGETLSVKKSEINYGEHYH